MYTRKGARQPRPYTDHLLVQNYMAPPTGTCREVSRAVVCGRNVDALRKEELAELSLSLSPSFPSVCLAHSTKHHTCHFGKTMWKPSLDALPEYRSPPRPYDPINARVKSPRCVTCALLVTYCSTLHPCYNYSCSNPVYSPRRRKPCLT